MPIYLFGNCHHGKIWHFMGENQIGSQRERMGWIEKRVSNEMKTN